LRVRYTKVRLRLTCGRYDACWQSGAEVAKNRVAYYGSSFSVNFWEFYRFFLFPTKMVLDKSGSFARKYLIAVQKNAPGGPALALRSLFMTTTTPISAEAREVVRCDFCSLVQYRTNNSMCRKCHKPLDVQETAAAKPQEDEQPVVDSFCEAGLQVAAQVREIRRARHLSQRQLAARMEVPRTYISKIENGKAIPTLGSLERLAEALNVNVCQLVRDSRSRRQEEVDTILSDPFLAELASLLPHLDSLQRTLFAGAVRDAALGRRRIA